MIQPQVEILFIAHQPWDRAISVQRAREFDLPFVRLLPKCVRPLFLHPVRRHRIGRQDEQHEIGLQTLADLPDNVVAWRDLAFIDPNFDLPTLFKRFSQVADERFVNAGVAEEDATHATILPSHTSYNAIRN